LDKHLIAEWLGEKLDSIPKCRRQISAAITGYEKKRDTPLRKNSSHLVDALASKVDIEHSRIALAFSSKAHGAGKRPGRSRDSPPGTRQDSFDLNGDEKLVLNHKDSCRGHRALSEGLKL